MKEEYQEMEYVDVTSSVASSEPGPPVVGAMTKVREAVHFVCAFYNVNYRTPVDKHEPTHEESSLDSVDLLLSKPPCNVRCGRENLNSHYPVLTFAGMAHAVAFGKRVMRSWSHGHLFCLRYSSVNCTKLCQRPEKRKRITVMVLWALTLRKGR